MQPSYIIWFSLIPLVIYAILWITIRTMEGSFHRYLYHKFAIMTTSGIILIGSAVIIIIISLFV